MMISPETQASSDFAPISKGRLWAGRILSGLFGSMMLLDAVMKIAKPEFVVKGTQEIGFPERAIVPLGIVLFGSVVLYLIPRTSVLGAILLTGYLGGAVATHVHAGHGVVQMLIPAIFSALLWGGLCLRQPRLSAAIFGPR